MTGTTDLMHTLAWSLLHFLWQGAAIAAVAAACMFVFRKPATRYVLGIGALALMLASFVITFSLINGPSESRLDETTPTTALALPLQSSADSMRQFMAQDTATAPDFVWIARGWLVGVCAFALRIAFGLLLLEYLRRRNLVALPPALIERFRALQQRIGIRRAIRYCECQMLRVPAVIGIFRPIVLLPVRALTGLTPEQLDAVIAHELGHIKRLDVAVNFFQVIAETLFFFHPAVWWLNRRIRADREDCCDDVAIAASGEPVGYARALATMEGWRDVPVFAMAATGSPVAARVARLLGISQRDTASRTAGVVTASLVLATALVAGVVSIGISNPVLAQAAEGSLKNLVVQADVATVAPVVSVEPVVSVAPGISVKPVANVRPVVQLASEPNDGSESADEAEQELEVEQREEVQGIDESQRTETAERAEDAQRFQKAERALKPERPAKPPTAPKPPRAATPARDSTAPGAAGTSYIEEMKSVGFDNLDVDHLIALRVHGVNADFVREIRASDLNPDVDLLIAMKSQGISQEYVKEIRDLGFKPDGDELVAMRIHGVTPEYVRQIRAAGFSPKAGEFIAMRVHGVTPEYHQALEKAGYKLTVSETIAAKVMGITPEFIDKVRAGGFRNMNIDKLIQLKNADIL